jgi:type IV pilus assembly protein PilW
MLNLNVAAKKVMPSQRQGGFTIIELMIAGLLGIILTAGVIQLFVGSNRNYTLQNELANVQEDGRFALIFLENEIQKGGWIDDFIREVPPAIDLNNSADGARDRIAVSYALPPDSRDCNGAVVADGLIVNQFFVGGASGEELMCLGNGGGAAQPLIDGVKNFQVLYGVETSGVCPDGAVNQYMTRDQIVASGGNLVIVSARVALLLGSENDVLTTAESHTHDLLDTQMTTNDRLAYRTFQQTIYMPNAIYATAGNPEMAITCRAERVGT